MCVQHTLSEKILSALSLVCVCITNRTNNNDLSVRAPLNDMTLDPTTMTTDDKFFSNKIVGIFRCGWQFDVDSHTPQEIKYFKRRKKNVWNVYRGPDAPTEREYGENARFTANK